MAETCKKCNNELVNNNYLCNNCDNDCCIDVIDSKCVNHDCIPLNIVLEDLILKNSVVAPTYNLQSVGGLNNSTEKVAIDYLINTLNSVINKTYDLSGITVGGVPGGAALSSDSAIQFLINKVNEEH